MTNDHDHRVRDYDRLARVFDHRLGLYTRQTLEQALETAHLTGTEKVLDACCGTGELLQLMALHGHTGEILGIDFSETMLNVASRRVRDYPNVTLKQSDIRQIDAPRDHFQVVFHTNALHYLDNPRESMAELWRVLAPHGRLVLVDLAANSRLTRFWTILRRLVRPVYRKTYQVEEVTELLRKAGFAVMRKRVSRINLFWSVMLIEAQKLTHPRQ